MNYILKALYPKFRWEMPTHSKVIYLTFDDGPVPIYTEFVLDQLKQYQAKATFFVIGHNVEKHPEIMAKVLENGHTVGNHTFNHLNGWKTDQNTYIENFVKCQEIIERYAQSHLFRPPYGRIKRKQAGQILDSHEIVMWSVLTRDYDKNYDAEKCLQNAIKNTRAVP